MQCFLVVVCFELTPETNVTSNYDFVNSIYMISINLTCASSLNSMTTRERNIRTGRSASPIAMKRKLRPRLCQSTASASSESSDENDTEKVGINGAARIRAKDDSSRSHSGKMEEERRQPQERKFARAPPFQKSGADQLPATRGENQHGRTRSGAYMPRKDNDPPPARYFRITHPPKLPQPMGDFLEIFQTEEHGRGVRTTRDDIPQGTVLYTEYAAIRAPSFLKDHEDELTKRIRGKVAALTADQRAAFISLSHADGPDTEETRFARNCFEDRDLALFDTMAPSLGASPEEIEGIYTLWLQIAMLNHSCRPNAIMLIRNAELAIADLIATVDIPIKGTELNISYLRGAEVGTEELLTEERQELLWNGWKFKCLCTACVCAQPVAHNESNPTSKDDVSDRNSSVSSIGFETSDDRLQYMHKLGEDLGLIADSSGNVRPLLATSFDKLFSQYEHLLEAERMVYPLYHAHQKAIEAYTLHYTDMSNDELTYARILYHRERLNKYSRICYGNEEAQKSGSRYVKELRGEINRPRAAKDDGKMLERDKRRKLPMKATSSHVVKLGTQTRPIEIEESDGDTNALLSQAQRSIPASGSMQGTQNVTEARSTTSRSEARPAKRRRTTSLSAEDDTRNSAAHTVSKRARMHQEARRKPAESQMPMYRDARGDKAGGQTRHAYMTTLKKSSGVSSPKVRLKPSRKSGQETLRNRNTGDGAKQLLKQVQSPSLNGSVKSVTKAAVLDHGTGSSVDDPIALD